MNSRTFRARTVALCRCSLGADGCAGDAGTKCGPVSSGPGTLCGVCDIDERDALDFWNLEWAKTT